MASDATPDPVPDPDPGPTPGIVPGEILVAGGERDLTAGLPAITLRVVNGGDRPIQVGSHYHLAEANPALVLDREAAWGHRLDVPSGTAVRFEPGVELDVTLVPLRGQRRVPGLRGAAAGALDEVTDVPAGLAGAGITPHEHSPDAPASDEDTP